MGLRLGLTAMALALLASLVTVAPALAWHVDTGDCAANPAGAIREPFGDPWGRAIIRNDRVCRGWVAVPDESWVRGGTFTVDGTSVAIGRGERAQLRPGSYVGRWSNSRELEHFSIQDRTPTVVVGWSFIQDGRTITKAYRVPPGCSQRTGYQRMDGSTPSKLWDRTHHKLLRPLKGQHTKLITSRPGFYKQLWHGYTKGLSCPGFRPA